MLHTSPPPTSMAAPSTPRTRASPAAATRHPGTLLTGLMPPRYSPVSSTTPSRPVPLLFRHPGIRGQRADASSRDDPEAVRRAHVPHHRGELLRHVAVLAAVSRLSAARHLARREHGRELVECALAVRRATARGA